MLSKSLLKIIKIFSGQQQTQHNKKENERVCDGQKWKYRESTTSLVEILLI